MTSESIPSACKECPHARENAYTKNWYCIISGAPLGSKRALDYCTCSKGTVGSTSSVGSSTTSPSPGPGSTPDGTANTNPAPQSQEAQDGSTAQNQAGPIDPTDEELIYGSPYDAM